MRLPCPKIHYVLEVRESQGTRFDSNPTITTRIVGGRLAVPACLLAPTRVGQALPLHHLGEWLARGLRRLSIFQEPFLASAPILREDLAEGWGFRRRGRPSERQICYVACGHYPKASLTNISASEVVMPEERPYSCAAEPREA